MNAHHAPVSLLLGAWWIPRQREARRPSSLEPGPLANQRECIDAA